MPRTIRFPCWGRASTARPTRPGPRRKLGVCNSWLSACGGGSGVSETSPQASAVTAQIGPAGGTLTGPDGVQVVVPPGALAQLTTLGISRSASGAPATQPQDNPAASPIYEFTPHGLVFDIPVSIRIPMPANAAAAAFMASPGEDWQVNDTTVTNGVAEWQRNSFSFGMIPYACTKSPTPADPYPCTYPQGSASATATPAQAITRRTAGNPFSNAGTWAVTEASTVHMPLNYRAAADCGNARIKLLRWNPAVSGSLQTVLEQGVGLTPAAVSLPPGTFASGTGVASYLRGVGSTTVDIDLSHLDNGTVAFGFSFSCSRPFNPVIAGGDLLSFAVSIPAVSVPVPSVTHTVGGTVSGLVGMGLVLQNGAGNHLAVAAAGAFTFVTPVADNASYNVGVQTQPAGQTCTVQNGSGTASAAVTNVVVACVAVAAPGGLALVANSTSNTLSILRINATSGALTSLGTVATGSYPYSVVMTPNGLFAYVSNLLGSSLSAYNIDSVAGSVSPIPLSSPATVNPYGVAMDPLGRFIWVVNYSASTVSAFAISASTGVLTAVGAPVATGSYPYALAVHPTGNYVYVANEVGNSVSVFGVNHSTGALTLLAGTIANSVLGPHSIAVDPTGRFAYAVSNSGASVAAFSINANTGVLSVVGHTNTGASPNSVAVHPNGHYVYVANVGSSTITVFSIDSGTGALTVVGAPVPTGSSPHALTIDAMGATLYVANLGDNSSSAFSIDAVSGALTSLGAATATGSQPIGFAVTPRGQPH